MEALRCLFAAVVLVALAGLNSRLVHLTQPPAMTSVYPNIHDRARALSNSTGVSLTAAYSTLAKRAGAARAAMTARRKAKQTPEVPARAWMPYADL